MRQTTCTTTTIIFHDSKVIVIISDIRENDVHSFHMIQCPKSTPCRLNMKMVMLKKRIRHLAIMNLRWLCWPCTCEKMMLIATLDSNVIAHVIKDAQQFN